MALHPEYEAALIYFLVFVDRSTMDSDSKTDTEIDIDMVPSQAQPQPQAVSILFPEFNDWFVQVEETL
jgi:hypothetical protein